MDSQLTYTRLTLSTTIILLSIYFYACDIIGYSPKSNCYSILPISCRKLTFIIFSILVILELGNFAKVGTSISFIVQKIPKYYYLALMIVIPYLMGMIYLTKEPIEPSDNFRAYPSSAFKRKTRPRIILLLILLFIVSLVLEAYNLYKIDPLNWNIGKAIGVITSHPDGLLSIFSKTRFLQIPILIILYFIHKNYTSCAYDLPRNWNY